MSALPFQINDQLLAILLCANLVLLAAVLILLIIARRDIEESRRDLSDARADLQRSLDAGTERTEQRMEYLRSSVDSSLQQIRADNAARLEQMRRTVDEKLQDTLDSRLSRSFAAVQSSLDRVYTGLGQMQELASGVGDLKKVLSNVKTRGILGEVQLGAILDQILAKDQYLEDVATVPGSRDRVEFAVHMPGAGDEEGVLMPIDAKFPGDLYARLQDAYDQADPQAIEAARKALALRIRAEAKDIHDKYLEPPFTTDFGVLFLPFEGLYAEVVNMGLLESLQRDHHVMIAGPSTMAALLNSLQMGFRTLAIQENAGKVWKVLGSVKTEFDKFEGVLTNAQRRINQANEELDLLVGTRTRMIRRSLQDIQAPDGLPGGEERR